MVHYTASSRTRSFSLPILISLLTSASCYRALYIVSVLQRAFPLSNFPCYRFITAGFTSVHFSVQWLHAAGDLNLFESCVQGRNCLRSDLSKFPFAPADYKSTWRILQRCYSRFSGCVMLTRAVLTTRRYSLSSDPHDLVCSRNPWKTCPKWDLLQSLCSLVDSRRHYPSFCCSVKRSNVSSPGIT